jgi:hypothetical protein
LRYNFKKDKKYFYSYLAGFVDGEGSISSTKVRGRTKLLLKIANTNLPVIKFISKNFNRKFSVRNSRKRTLLGKLPYYGFQISGRSAVDLIRRIYPFLIVKKKLATWAIKYKVGIPYKRLDKKTKTLRERIHREICKINSKRNNYMRGRVK